MQRGREELCKRYSETKADALRLEGKLIEFEKYKTQLEDLKETVAYLNKENSFLKLERRVTELDTTVYYNQNRYNKIFFLNELFMKDNDNMDKALIELRNSTILLQDLAGPENCSMQAKVSSAISELSSKEETIAFIKETSKKRKLVLDEKLGNVKSQKRNL